MLDWTCISIPAKNGQVQKREHPHPMELNTRGTPQMSTFDGLFPPQGSAGAQ
jgi:hypothetical protein